MADFAIKPDYNLQIEGGPPPTLQTLLSDGKVISRVKHANAPQGWLLGFSFTGAEFDIFKAFFELKGLATPWSMYSLDVGATPTQERTVRFAGAWRLIRSGEDAFDVEVPVTRHY